MATIIPLLETQYFPPVQYFSVLAQAKEVWLEAQEHYQKRSYRNRCHIAGANGEIRLSVPLEKGKHEQMPITEVQIAYQRDWFGEHWYSIRSAYGKAPFFEYYAGTIKAWLWEKPERLFRLNTQLTLKLLELLQVDCQLKYTEMYLKQPPPSVTDLRGAIHPKKPRLQFEGPFYAQVFQERHGFLPNLSILDLLFCTGPQASVLLQQFAEQNPVA